MINVIRTDLISQLWMLSQTGSVVLAGSPGCGKSWAVAQLMKRCKRETRKFLSLAAEDFDVTSVDELNQAIGLKVDLLSLLRSFGPNPLLIIDGLDALRGEGSQKAFRDLIQKIMDDLPRCSIVVSIRTFDLQQSPELQRLFFNRRDIRAITTLIVQPFSENDLHAVCDQIPALKSVLMTKQSEVRELLRNPFNLRLAVELIEEGLGIDELATVHSQVQLLQRYWFMRVENLPDGPDRKALLRRIVREMVNRNALSIREESSLSPGSSNLLRRLRSAEVLRESVTDRISFFHNIIFDYAIARLIFDEEELFDFIASDSSRTIFFRPSIQYFFHHLWWNDRALFWTVAVRCFTDPQLPERIKVVPAVVLSDAAHSMEDLAPLLGDQGVSTTREGLALILRAVQALGALQTPRRKLWLDVLGRLVNHPELDIVNEFVALLSSANQSKAESLDSQLGTIARNLLLWMWQKAELLPSHQADQLLSIAASRVMPIVMQQYATDKSASYRIVLSALDRLGTPAASPQDAFWLAHEIKLIIAHDSPLAVLAYERMFGHPEQSEETTTLGSGGAVFTLTSTKKQDFETALYGLLQSFPYFVDKAPEQAARAAILAINAEIQRVRPFVEREQALKHFKFRLGNRSANYVSDHSEIWDHVSHEHLSLQLLDIVLRRKTAIAPSDLRALIRVFSECARLAVCWKRLIEASASNVRVFYPYIRGLLKIPRFLAAPEVTISIGNLLKAAYDESVVGDSDRRLIENAISRIASSRFIKRYEKPESIQNRLSFCIGADRLLTPELRSRAREVALTQTSFANEPYIKITGGPISYSTKDWLRDEGADTTSGKSREILAVSDTLASFEAKYLNSVPTAEECEAVEPQLRQLHQLLEDTSVDQRVSEHARGVLCAATESILKNQELLKEASLTRFCRLLVLQYVKDPLPAPTPDMQFSFDMPSWGGALPRIEAAQGLMHLLWNYGPDSEITQALAMLAKDAVPAVRYQVAAGLLGFYKHHNNDEFWNFVSEMMSNETTPGVMLALLGTIGQIAGNDPGRVVTQLAKAIDRGLPEAGRSEMPRALIQILTGLYLARANKRAGEELARFEADPVRYSSEVSNAIFTASHYLVPQNATPDVRERARTLFRRILNASYIHLGEALTFTDEKEKANAITAVMRHIDEIASRMYFALDIDPGLRRPENTLTEEQRRGLYFDLKPLISLVVIGGSTGVAHQLLPRTAHHLLETLNGVLQFDPSAVIELAAQAAKAASTLNYHFDSMAIKEVVQLVEHSLADHKESLKAPYVAAALGNLLDIFVRAGWPEALQLTFKLDEAFR